MIEKLENFIKSEKQSLSSFEKHLEKLKNLEKIINDDNETQVISKILEDFIQDINNIYDKNVNLFFFTELNIKKIGDFEYHIFEAPIDNDKLFNKKYHFGCRDDGFGCINCHTAYSDMFYDIYEYMRKNYFLRLFKTIENNSFKDFTQRI